MYAAEVFSLYRVVEWAVLVMKGRGVILNFERISIRTAVGIHCASKRCRERTIKAESAQHATQAQRRICGRG